MFKYINFTTNPSPVLGAVTGLRCAWESDYRILTVQVLGEFQI
jgi:hypothetical protein